ncbi:MAG: hypothetical protein OXQ89_22760 [Rhodospirillaceae bacterium]|nr:hypothetical protein [Rhodospirillaceae bacterium]
MLAFQAGDDRYKFIEVGLVFIPSRFPQGHRSERNHGFVQFAHPKLDRCRRIGRRE